ncbi:MAG: IPT/TIG domain-containing protein, partial [Chloroflexi bacterium]|nr:IPT/TIG domain-containing protein [Chloroflexota bacterium]
MLTPTVSGVNPGSGVQGQTLTSVVINGSNFASAATCDFGSGITVNSCTFNSATQMTTNITIASTAAPGGHTVNVTNPDTQSGSLANAFKVIQHIDLTYSSSTALKADRWDFLAKTAANVTRNTEQSGTLAVDYDQVAHPGAIRIPLGSGELWQTLNNSQNTLFRDLPSDWTSIRVKLAAFNPVANYQQVGLLAYQDDDNYVDVNRPYIDTQGGQAIELFRESSQVTSYINRQSLLNTSNLILRLDRNAATNIYTGYYSVDGGTNWVALGSTATALVNPRL